MSTSEMHIMNRVVMLTCLLLSGGLMVALTLVCCLQVEQARCGSCSGLGLSS